ncbi:adenosine deaminase [Rathayibacter sp. VKM Ac-2759]|uniref:adenosine deaminase n=1 Tax=Rathayibacter sp. VKM Ac-2759 TaxID=2609252 RepID=UPI00131793F6|nr:adenosine deaminase [Rathayibacter sp. VKM Ac-2759]QHC68066.1 adenosine deaminase [Rathayibacter sp. VKM Ac-2759]
MSADELLRRLPKTELHCHFASTMSAAHLIAAAESYGVPLASTDPATLFDFDDLQEFLVAFRAAHRVLRTPADLATVAYDGVRAAAAQGLRYREYAVNPQYFADHAFLGWGGLGYAELLDPILDGLRAAETDLGVGFGIVVAVNRRDSAASAVDLVEQIRAHPRDEVLALGMDDLTPEGAEDPARFAEAFALARRSGLKLTAHVGETDHSEPDAVRIALDELRVDRIDHGYRILDDPDLVARARDSGIGFTTTPISTTICSGWTLDPSHRIAAMVRAGLRVTVSTDDAVFFRTDLEREYREALPALGLSVDDACTIALNGVEAAFCAPEQKARLRAEFTAAIAELRSAENEPHR